MSMFGPDDEDTLAFDVAHAASVEAGVDDINAADWYEDYGGRGALDGGEPWVRDVPYAVGSPEYRRGIVDSLAGYADENVRFALSGEEGRCTAALLRGMCRYLDLPMPAYLRHWWPCDPAFEDHMVQQELLPDAPAG